MEIYKMGVVEEKFAELVWEHGAIPSGELVQLAGEHLEWKKSTTYTVIKKLCNKGILNSEGGIVSAALSKDQYLAKQSKRFVEETFQGSLPGFLAAFTREETLGDKEIAQIRDLIDSLGK
jgi:predicted transcriptional regulator